MSDATITPKLREIYKGWFCQPLQFTESCMSIAERSLDRKKYYGDSYAKISFFGSIPCIRIDLAGTPKCSEHYQLVQERILDAVIKEVPNYTRLSLLTDGSRAGMVLEENLFYYTTTIQPAIARAGIRSHAIVLPTSFFPRLMFREHLKSGQKMNVKHFNFSREAFNWLRKQ